MDLVGIQYALGDVCEAVYRMGCEGQADKWSTFMLDYEAGII